MKFLRSSDDQASFDFRWISLIMKCISSLSYNVVVNGALTDSFYPKRGIHQGDPLFSYLFLLCTKSLLTMLPKFQREGVINGTQASRNGPRINDMFFTDDNMLFA